MTNFGVTGRDHKNAQVQASELGRRIDAVAKRIGTRKIAALAAQTSPDSLQRWIRDENVPSFDAAARLCLTAGVRMEWLATGDGPMLAGEKPITKAAEPAQHEAFMPAAHTSTEHQLSHLPAALRIVEGVLRKYGIRNRVNADQFAELVRLVFYDLGRGADDDAASAALSRILAIIKSTPD